jgi:hypothetical protein
VNGLFSVYLGGTVPFGSRFADFSTLWLEIGADTGSGMEIYAPRVPLACVPYAQHAKTAVNAANAVNAISAGNADNLGGQPPSNFAPAAHQHAGGDITSGTVPFARLPVGTGAGEVAAGNHMHNLNDLGDVNAAGPAAGQTLTWSGSEWAAVGGYAVIRDVRNPGVDAGQGNAGANDRVLNDLDTNIPGLTLSSNVFTLPPGRYKITASAPAFYINRHKIVLRNPNSGAILLTGTAEDTPQGMAMGTTTRSFIEGRITLATSTPLHIRHYLQSARGGDGLGRATNIAGVQEVYTLVNIERY